MRLLLLHLVQVVHLFTPHLVTHLVTHHLVTQPVAAGSSPRLAPLTGPARAAAPSPPAMEPVYWHSANPRFQGGQGLVLYPQIGDKLDIICPHEFRPAGAQGAAPYEYHRLYVVSREQADRCDTVQRPRVLLTCERPDADLRYTLKFQEVSPNFLGLEFRRHRDYYITSTSNGTLEGLENQRGGVCRSHAMRILLRVGQDPRAPAHVTSVTRRPTPGSGSSREPVVIVVPPPPHGGGGGAPPPTNRPGVSDPRSGVGEGPGPGPGGETLLGSDVALIVGVASGCLIFLLLALFLLLFLLRQRRRSNHHHHNHHHGNNNHNNSNHAPLRHPGPYSLTTLANARRAVSLSAGGGGGGPRRRCWRPRPGGGAGGLVAGGPGAPHYEKVSGDYGHPIYIVQGPDRSPSNVYYKV
uniref:Ephrin-B1-like n=1 Tax=Petromyzon marinus TaxID=7757 RepID=A0AAJ7UHK7_PETMA|nr:ephrin-B1-like [Petromyzon marinus]